MKFKFRFHHETIEIHPAALAEFDPSLRALREECIRTAGDKPGLTDDARRNLGDQAMAGIVARLSQLHGDAWLAKATAGFRKIAEARNDITGELYKALNGSPPDYGKMQGDYNEIDIALAEVVSPDKAEPPKVSMETLLGGGVAAEPAKTLPDFLKGVPEAAAKLSSRQQTLLDRAQKLAPDALLKLLHADGEASFKPSTSKTVRKGRPFEEMQAAMDRESWSDRDKKQLMDTLSDLNESWHKSGASLPEGYQAHLEAATAALSSVPDGDRLQLLVQYSPTLKKLLHDSPDQLIDWWKDYNSELRKVGFHRYVGARMNLVKGHLGEFTAAFQLGRTGVFVFLKGPKADVNGPGTDLVCLDIYTGEQFYIDNKAIRSEVLNGVTALIQNFPKNLGDDVAAFRNSMGSDADPRVQQAIGRADAASQRIERFLKSLPNDAALREDRIKNNYRVTLPTGEKKPVWDVINEILEEHGISRVVTNSGGQVSRMRKAIADAKVLLENLNVPDPGDNQ